MFKRLRTDKQFFYRFILLMILISCASAFATYTFEKGSNTEFDQPIDWIFWWVASMTTAGTGPFPITDMGKVFGIITMLSGAVFYLAVLSELILWIKTKSDEKLKGLHGYKGAGHVVVVGYNELALGLINLLDRVLKPSVDVILLTNDIDTNPNVDRVQFVKRDPATNNSLSKVNIDKAKVAFVLSRDDLIAKKVDLSSLIIAGMIEEIESDVFTLAEVTSEAKVKDYKFISVDTYFTFQELLNDLKIGVKDKDIKLIKKLPEKLRQDLLKDEYH